MRLSILFGCVLASGCSVINAQIPMQGGMASVWSIRPMGSSAHAHLEYDPQTHTLIVDYGQINEKIDYRALGQLIGTATGEAIKAAN